MMRKEAKYSGTRSLIAGPAAITTITPTTLVSSTSGSEMPSTPSA